MKRNIHRRRLTIAEEEIMLILWKRKHALIKDIMEDCTEPRPAYNTVSTVLRVMEKKGFVGHRKVGVFYEFHPLIDKAEYAKKLSKWLIEDYYDNSVADLVAACAENCPKEALTNSIAQIAQIIATKN
ncbi:MAG: BlaI/MecI/CopY family transcriptional regulator [Bacteroidales bacterium]|nr:BlaI/MecI/CopY family transcriptional regulator [Bacteroidales bacterium]MBR3286995.1 BlaI/MecI/CopY family transcriptional regulator [Bacteroidales bacterium]MCR5714175.1 BlaI/MecI/CopY family transcriptional regulator [Bacteroidales bacterium]